MTFQEVIFEIMWMFFQNPYPISYLGGIAGEEVLLFMAFLASHFSVPMAAMLFFGILGILTFDSAMFFFSRSELAQNLKEKFPIVRKYAKVPLLIEKFWEKYTFLTLAFSKFIFSVRIPLVAFLSRRGMDYKKFIIYDIGAVGLWAVVMVPLAYLAGKGFSYGLDIARNFFSVIGVAIMFIVIVYLLNRVIIDEILVHAKLIKNKFWKRK